MCVAWSVLAVEVGTGETKEYILSKHSFVEFWRSVIFLRDTSLWPVPQKNKEQKFLSSNHFEEPYNYTV